MNKGEGSEVREREGTKDEEGEEGKIEEEGRKER